MIRTSDSESGLWRGDSVSGPWRYDGSYLGSIALLPRFRLRLDSNHDGMIRDVIPGDPGPSDVMRPSPIPRVRRRRGTLFYLKARIIWLSCLELSVAGNPDCVPTEVVG